MGPTKKTSKIQDLFLFDEKGLWLAYFTMDLHMFEDPLNNNFMKSITTRIHVHILANTSVF
jgi:hypothetical protein